MSAPQPIPLGVYARLVAARPAGLVVCVTGGRDFTNAVIVNQALDKIHADKPISMLVNGGATGADALARAWAKANRIETHTEAALWALYGQRAGPIRNGVMVSFAPDLVVAFPGGAGTRDMVTKSVQAGLQVVHITDLG